MFLYRTGKRYRDSFCARSFFVKIKIRLAPPLRQVRAPLYPFNFNTTHSIVKMVVLGIDSVSYNPGNYSLQADHDVFEHVPSRALDKPVGPIDMLVSTGLDCASFSWDVADLSSQPGTGSGEETPLGDFRSPVSLHSSIPALFTWPEWRLSCDIYIFKNSSYPSEDRDLD